MSPGRVSRARPGTGKAAPRHAANSLSPSNAAERPRLTDNEKKRNHIRSEQKRRQAIREGFDTLAALMPNFHGTGKSESIVLDVALAAVFEQIERRIALIKVANDNGLDTTGWALHDDTIGHFERMSRAALQGADDQGQAQQQQPDAQEEADSHGQPQEQEQI